VTGARRSKQGGVLWPAVND
jgi:uncharacterized protein YecA (UPF0149 family)